MPWEMSQLHPSLTRAGCCMQHFTLTCRSHVDMQIHLSVTRECCDAVPILKNRLSKTLHAGNTTVGEPMHVSLMFPWKHTCRPRNTCTHRALPSPQHVHSKEGTVVGEKTPHKGPMGGTSGTGQNLQHLSSARRASGMTRKIVAGVPTIKKRE